MLERLNKFTFLHDFLSGKNSKRLNGGSLLMQRLKSFVFLFVFDLECNLLSTECVCFTKKKRRQTLTRFVLLVQTPELFTVSHWPPFRADE
jgi:hypothetical protein